ncbi:NERD domain protein [Parafrankia sp. EAN1pec]|uniref:nuclease-related domain-containing protein n=1 Tax=Parafrankia sp. (strain EAN1pec) TaxID=298653 RepID=UPI0000542AA2|nr:NERD domain protein [Frankia sp. EAN1pec]
MTSVIDILWGSEPVEASEQHFLGRLQADLQAHGVTATVFANFHTAGSRQVDFLVITPGHACHVELKAYRGPIHGGRNGQWSSTRPDGTTQVIERSPNPYEQTVRAQQSISDDMRAFASGRAGTPRPSDGRQFYTWFDSVLCVYPRLAVGSEVPSDFKVKTFGYPELLDFLLKPGKNPPWDAGIWREFGMHLNLVRPERPDGPSLAATRAQQALDDYTRRFSQFHRQGLHELVPSTLEAGETAHPSSELPTLLAGTPYAQIVAPSGYGKSHLAHHTALTLASEGTVPIFLSAARYEGRLSVLMDRAVAPYSPQPALNLLRAATSVGRDVLLVVDGFNECPERERDALVQDISALCLRSPCRVLVTAQHSVSFATITGWQEFRLRKLDEDERRAVLASYDASVPLDLCGPFETAYELSIAAECSSELREGATRATLLDAFVRHRLQSGRSPALTRSLLRRLAVVMDERLVTALPIGDVWRIGEAALREQQTPSDILDEVFRASVVSVEQGVLTFSHELIGRYLAAEELLLAAGTNMDDLTSELQRPRHEDLPALVIPLETSEDCLRQLFNCLASKHLLVEALGNKLGPRARAVAVMEAERVLAELCEMTAGLKLVFGSTFETTVTGGRDVTGYEAAVLAAVGDGLADGDFLGPAMRLLDATDEACRTSTAAQAASGHRPTPSDIAAAVVLNFAEPGSRRKIASHILLDSARLGWPWRYRHRKGVISSGGLEEVSMGGGEDNYCRLFLMGLLLDRVPLDVGQEIVMSWLRMCWQSGAYHVQLQALESIRAYCQLEAGPLRSSLVDYLSDLQTQNLGLSTTIVEALYSFGEIEPQISRKVADDEIREVLEKPADDSEACGRAYGIVSNSFEDVLGPHYFEAIEALGKNDRVRLLTKAALGVNHGFWLDWVLGELLKLRDPQAIPAFERYATAFDVRSPSPQEAVSCYILAMQGCGNFLDTPPRFHQSMTVDLEAWQCYGAITFWLAHPMPAIERADRCAPIWARLATELVEAAADPLYQLAQTYVKDQDAGKHLGHNLVLDTFPDEVRVILEAAASNFDRQTAIFRAFDPIERSQYVLRTLGLVGNEGSLRLIEPYIEDPSLGSTAIETLKALRARF